MRNLNPKYYAYYIIFGAIIHFWYGVFDHYYYTPPGEPLWARWPIVGIVLVLAVSILTLKLSQNWAENLFYFSILLFSWHYLYLIEQTHAQADYFQGFWILLTACSLLIFRASTLYLYYVTTVPLAIFVGLRIEDDFSTALELMNFLFIALFVFIGTILKINLTDALGKAREGAEQAKKKLESTYKQNLQAAHDLSSPVSAINVVGDKIKYEDPKLHKLLESSVERIKDISRELLADHRERKDEVESDFFDLENNISQIIADKRQEYENVPHFFIMYRVTAPVINQVKIPKTEFYRVLSNIINNSMDAMEEQREKRIKIVIDPRSEDLSLLVSDNGEGIAAEQVDRIFDENVSFKAKGTGLGLSFARNKVKEWGGQIHLKSTSGKGTTFELIIPYSFN